MTYDNRTESYGSSRNSYETSSSSSQTFTRRYLKRSDRPRMGFVPWGLLPVLLLSVVTLLGITTCAESIQNDAALCGEDALAEAGYDWADVSVSGQWLTLKGKPPSSAIADQAERIVRNACQSDSWRATRVTDDYDPVITTTASNTDAADTPSATTPADDIIVPTPTTQPTVIAEIERVNPNWAFRLKDGVLRLEGEVPSEKTRRTIQNAARAAIDPPRIVSVDPALQISGKPAHPDYLQVALRGVNTISRCEDGVAALQGEVFSLNCELEQSRVSIVRSLANASMPFGRLGVIDILPSEQLQVCEDSMRSLLSTSRIEFASGSARILDSSSGLLDRVATAARTCPGRLQIDGHTDNVGEFSPNLALSRQRAEAVRIALIRRNVAANRLTTRGFGESRPIAENTTAEGRAKNRRTEIHVVRTIE